MRSAKTFSLFAAFLLAISAVLAGSSPAAAQQQEKRIALVVGNGAYAKSPLATTANDAGLIAQTLQAAGFDVVGARDLDGDTLRKSFRDFVQKAQSSGPDTVAMVYLAGYGVQLAGENYFIPVDSTISRDTDIPTEGLRISDYTRQLASVPLKASVVVLDAARQQPFIEGGQPIASGLALVEPDANMLIAFNAAPGTVAPSEPGPYGVYAQSLAEMIRTGGLPLPEVFDRLRLRVNDASKGGQVPWDAHKIQSPFSFFDRAPDAPPTQGTPDQVAAIRDRPIRDLGVQDAYAAALERDTLQAYDDFLLTYPNDPLARRVRAIVAARREAITWRRTYRADTPDAYWSYLRRYPNGPHAGDARRRLAILTAPLEPPPSFAMLDYDVPPPPPDEIVYVDRPVLYFSDPDFGFVPPPPPPVYYLPPPPPDFVVLAPPIAPVGLFILPQPMFVPMPVYVRPPVYVAPPPNNVIFNNIHNTTVINNVINQPPPPLPPAGPGGPAAPIVGPHGAAAAAAAGPALPTAAVQRATLIQQGKLPVPLSATIKPTGTGGTPVPTPTPTPSPANLAPNALPHGQGQPNVNALPVPGGKGGPPVLTPQGGGTVTPGARMTLPSATLTPTPTPSPTNLPNRGNPAVVPTKPGMQTTTVPNGRKDTVPPPPPPPAALAKPTITTVKPVTPPPPPPPPPPLGSKPQVEIQRASPPAHLPPPPPAVVHTPPPPSVRTAVPPPPVVHAAPPPAVVHAAPPPPPPPPPVVHAAPPVLRQAPPPPPPPPPAARAVTAPPKKCPPNNPKC